MGEQADQTAKPQTRSWFSGFGGRGRQPASVLPLHVYQVLEEEYTSLHGADDTPDIVKLPDQVTGESRLMRVQRDALFHRGQIRNPVALAEKLLKASDDTMRDLCVYLVAQISQQTLEQVVRDVGPFVLDLNALFDYDETPGKEGAQKPNEGIEKAKRALTALETALNAVLTRPDLYTAERFKQLPLGDILFKVMELVQSPPRHHPAVRAGDVIHVNRLLLERVFPDDLERLHNARLAAIHQRFHALPNHAALSLSGGGIRSGTFALGLLQGLARRDLLKEFDYLSTVSGGGYIGGWLSAWLHRHPDGLAGVTRSLANQPPERRIDPDPDSLLHLRNYSNFITPKVGLLTADTWTFISIYVRNLTLNWMVIIPLVIAWLMIPRLYLSVIVAEADRAPWLIAPRYFLLVVGALLAAVATAFVSLNRPRLREELRARNPYWFRRTDQSGFLWWCLLPLTTAAVTLTIYWAWSLEARQGTDAKDGWIYAGFGGAVAFAGWLLSWSILRVRMHKAVAFEVGVLTLAGAAAGLLFWVTELVVKDQTPSVVVNQANFATDNWITTLYTVFATPLFLSGFVAALTIFTGFTSHSRTFTDEDREWWARANAWLGIVIIGWISFNGLVIFGPLALLAFPKVLGSIGGLSGVIALFAGRSTKTPATGEAAAGAGALMSLGMSTLPVLAMVFLGILAALVSLLTSWILFTAGIATAPEWWQSSGSLAPPEFRHLWTLHTTPAGWAVAVALIAFLVGMVMAAFINLNRFSLHAAYRSRLIRGFLGASREKGKRNPNPFTGFDPADNIYMHELRSALLHESDFTSIARLAEKLKHHRDEVSKYIWESCLSEETRQQILAHTPDALPAPAMKMALIEDLNRTLEDENAPLSDAPVMQRQLAQDTSAQKMASRIWKAARGDYGLMLNRHLLQETYSTEIRRKYPPPHRLLHIVNTALNLVGGDNLAWQQRKAEPFSISPLHAGCFRLGYRRARDFGGTDGISLGTAVAISGAAASSNMGYYTTSPALSMVLSLFNVRLGWWLGNPGPAGARTYRRQSPRNSITPILSEAFGLTDDENEYVYLSDGGHFENLALYEMVLRRCKIIIGSDGAADANYEFGDLGNAIRKIRIDLGVPIEFDRIPIGRGAIDPAGAGNPDASEYCAIGRIRYSCVDAGADDGVLIYIKPAVYGREPQDVVQYKRSHPTFPHETTADQFFDEPQFESYRALGSHILDELLKRAGDPNDLSGLAEGLKKTEPAPRQNP